MFVCLLVVKLVPYVRSMLDGETLGLVSGQHSLILTKQWNLCLFRLLLSGLFKQHNNSCEYAGDLGTDLVCPDEAVTTDATHTV